MDVFLSTFGGVSALCLGVIILSVFFTLLGYGKRAIDGSGIIAASGLPKKETIITVHLLGGRTLENVRLVGTTRESIKGDLPHQLTGMVVLENAQGLRTFVKAESVRIIEELKRA